MHRESRLLLGRNNAKKTQLLFLVFIFSGVRFFAKSLYVAGGSSHYSRGCDEVTCKIGEECVNRKFWCKHSPCPSMTYCSKSKRESLKGPDSCESVLCTSGYKCRVRAPGCEWNQSFTRTNCKERTARCVSDWEFQNDPASCTDVNCPMGHRCILQESHCYQVPCKLTRSCAETRDVQMWFDKCRQLGCGSEQQCFLRKPLQLCSIPPCNHVPDCLSTSYFEGDEYSPNEYCRGWICPPNQECSASFEVPCRHENCQVIRTCKGLLLPSFNASRDIQQPQDFILPQTTLADLEREAILEENRKLQNFLNPTSTFNVSKWMRSTHGMDEIMPTRVSMAYKNPNYETVKEKHVTSSPSIRSTSFGELPWLTYFKKKAGAQAVQYWIEKSKNNENYEGFVDWLESVSGLLDAETYRLWLRELKAISADIPEFQSWIVLHNLSPHPSAIYNRQSHSEVDADARSVHAKVQEDARRNFPGSVGKTTKNFYNNPFMQKQGAPGMSGESPRGSEFENSSEEHRSNPSNFNFNEVRQLDETPEFRPNIHSAAPPIHRPMLTRPFYKGNRQPGQSSTLPGFHHKVPDSPTQNYEDMNDPRKPWISFYKYPATPANIPEFASRMQDSFYLKNYTRGYKIFNKTTVSNINSRRQQQPQVFYPQNQNNYEKLLEDSNINQWSPRQMNGLKLKGVKISGDDIYRREYKPSNENLSGDTVSVEVGSIINQIAGFPQFNQMKQNIIKLESEQDTPRVLFPPNSEINSLPKLLIYFPPPLNFFIYYSVKNQNNTTNNNQRTKSSIPSIENTRMIVPWQSPSFNMSSSEESFDEKTKNLENDLESTKLKKLNKQKEFEYIRKIIRELIEYWDDEEKFLDNSKEEDYDNKDNYDNKPKENYKNQNTNNAKNLIDDDSAKPTFNTFLEWLTKNSAKDSSLLDQKPRKKEPLIYNQSEKHKNPSEHSDTGRSVKSNPINSSSYAENIDDTNSKKIRILVDIDKNPEAMQAFFARHLNAHSNKSDTHEYQIIVNLPDFFDPKEEDIISRKLIDIAANQLHKNVTNNEKMPKTLWVFPMYEDEENDTLITELENSKQEHINTLEDENASTTYKNDDSENIMHSYNRNNNYESKKVQKKLDSMQRDTLSSENDKSDLSDIEDSSKDTDNYEESYDETQNSRNIEKPKT